MKYDVSYNLTEEIRQLLDADYKHDINMFEIAKKHILLLIGYRYKRIHGVKRETS
jgi:hypothetical protein